MGRSNSHLFARHVGSFMSSDAVNLSWRERVRPGIISYQFGPVQIFGDRPQFLPGGVFCAESDNVGSLTEPWPEITYQYLLIAHQVPVLPILEVLVPISLTSRRVLVLTGTIRNSSRISIYLSI